MILSQSLTRRTLLTRTSLLTAAGVIAPLTTSLRSAVAQVGASPDGDGWPTGSQLVTIDELNLRAESNSTSAIVGTYPAGTAVETTGGPDASAGDHLWYPVQVIADGATGWMASDWLNPVDAADSYTAHVNSDNVNVRAEPGLSGTVLTTLNSGDTVYLDPLRTVANADGYAWSPVLFGSSQTSCWIASNYLGDPTATPEDPDDGDSGEVLTVNSSDVNLREEPGLSSAVLLTLYNGQPVNRIAGDELIEADSYRWVHVSVSGTATGHSVNAEGWVAANYVGLGDAPDRPYTSFEIVDGPLNLREEPGLSGAIIATYPTGATGIYTGTGRRITTDGYDWVNVEMSDGQAGYIAVGFTLDIA